MYIQEIIWKLILKTTLISGGYAKRKRVFRHDPVTKTTEELPNMLEKRSHTGCALFYSAKHDNRPVAYIGGSFGYGSDNTAEILDYTQTDEWERRKLWQYGLWSFQALVQN